MQPGAPPPSTATGAAMARRGALSTVLALIKLGRPLFLVGGVVQHGLGVAVARAAGVPLDLRAWLVSQVVVTAFQLMTHYCNDHFDVEADRANGTFTRWSGGSRVLVDGAVPPAAALAAAVVLAALGTGVSLAAVLAGGAVSVLLARLLVLLLSWEYSAPPLRLHSSGLGELVVAVVVTGLVPLLGHASQVGTLALPAPLLLAIVPPCLLQFAMVIAVAIPDADGDARVGKRTLVVRLSRRRAGQVYAAATLLAFAGLPALVRCGLPVPAAVGAAAAAPVGLWRAGRVLLAGDAQRADRFEGLAFWSVAVLTVASVGEAIGFLWLAR